MFRIRTSFRHKKDRVLSEISNRNASLYKFLEREQSSRLSRSLVHAPSEVNDGILASLLEFQEHAKSVFKGFQQHWTCSCSASSHLCRISARESHVKVLLENGTQITHINVEVDKTQMIDEKREHHTAQVSTKHKDAAVLTQQVSMKNRLSNLKKKDQRSIFKMTASTLFSLSNIAGQSNQMAQDSQEKTSKKLPKRYVHEWTSLNFFRTT
jgi:hypothetical protein